MSRPAKGLPELALLASVGPLDAAELRRAIEATFWFRGTHPIPPSVSPPSADWAPVYERMAVEDELRWPTLVDVHDPASSFLDHVLRGGLGTWNPATWSWGAT